MTEERTQTDDRQGGSEAEGTKESEKSLDSLLNEFETGGAKSKGNGAAEPRVSEAARSDHSGLARALEDLKPVIDFAKTEKTRREEEALNEELQEALQFLKEPDETKNMKDVAVRGFMEAYAIENKAFADAFRKRREDPSGWRAALEKGRDWLKEELKALPGSKAKDDLEAARAAVAETDDEQTGDDEDEGPSAADMFSMSDAEFNAFKAKKRAEAARKS